MIWSSEIWQKSLYLRNSKHCILYVGNFKWKNAQVEIRYSLEASSRDVKTIVKVCKLFFGYIKHRSSSCTSNYLLCLTRCGKVSTSRSIKKFSSFFRQQTILASIIPASRYFTVVWYSQLTRYCNLSIRSKVSVSQVNFLMMTPTELLRRRVIIFWFVGQLWLMASIKI